jgi:nitrite reductase/ring-hydroxylating ferredoxin subunit
LAALAPGGVTRVEVDGTAILGCRTGTDTFAFADRCARCDTSLAGATLTRRLGGTAGDALLCCPTCHAHYDVRHAGGCADAGQEHLHLQPFPLLADGATVSVAIPARVAP